MNYNQKYKIAQTPNTLMVGIDIDKHNHVARTEEYPWNRTRFCLDNT